MLASAGKRLLTLRVIIFDLLFQNALWCFGMPLNPPVSKLAFILLSSTCLRNSTTAFFPAKRLLKIFSLLS